MSNERAEEKDLTRRDFLTLAWRVLAAVAVGEAAYTGLRLLSSRQPEGAFGTVVAAGLVPDFPPGTVTPFDSARFFLARFEDGGFLALHSMHPPGLHRKLGRLDQHFVCPCHGSEFEHDGQVLIPPAPRPSTVSQSYRRGSRQNGYSPACPA